MFKNKSTDNGTNFWISYADLMAGLLFVFILLIGAIISKSSILKNNLHKKGDRLTQLSISLQDKEIALEKSRNLISQIEKELILKRLKLDNSIKTLKFKEDEITKLTHMLAEANAQKSTLSKQIIIVQQILNETNATLQKSLKDYEGKVLVLTDQVSDMNQTIKEKNIKLLKLLNAIDEKETKYDTLIAKLQKQKARIKSLTGIKLKIIAILKTELGNKIDIDKKSGSLKLASNILFDKGSMQLKEIAKVQLEKVFEEYIGTLVSDNRIRPYLEKIIIEGHTDSDGGYLYNLNLSQKRALAVMNYLMMLPLAHKYDLKPLVSASGRSYMDRIMHEGIEDKKASRRIEIKFRLKNEDAMQEIEKVLDTE
ncbi:MAG: OmpA family protein [Sulfurovum sp.]|nr:OmpA family protein [Sulfurovum sp.]MCB4773889.1 OmpA family protein [Sulfurovum sp.]